MRNNIDSVYIHIPFCTTICSYCDFCKIFYNKKYVNDYLNSLNKEINAYYKHDIIKTIYIGGGTPSSLSIDELRKLLNIIKIFKLAKDFEFTVELNIEHITKELLELLYKNKVNRISIGVQTFNQEHLKFLNRNHNKEEVIKKINLAKKVGFNNINIDLIYAIPNQTKEELVDDINSFFKLDVNHISTYSLIIEPRTKLYIKKVNNIDETLDYEMYELINERLTKKGYNHYELSNYSKPDFESKHNLQYWNNLEYYGFGAGASGYINDLRYTNTSSITKYINNHYRDEEEKVNSKIKLENEFILGLRKINGINKQEFYQKYGFDIYEVPNVEKLIMEGKLIDNSNNIYIDSKYLYLSNEILINFMV
ncbi:MAG: radical SAM family heme chaperone HemW [Bacilli bacterium]|nr:radical SAM family heme chaperone HemW [Bacilli bacterium]MDD4282424.1 radical SAM family heme chaperone HemW [Bacilli bacterium]MDD4718458.1 radical SAM family heme chaperone HemW [Bacilli bacterium]